jgi:hypothetical protein
VSWVAGADVAAVAVALAGRAGDGVVTDLGGPEALTLRELCTSVERELGITPTRTKAISPRVLRIGSRLLSPFNELLSRRMQLGALLDTQPQVVDSAAAWKRFGVTPGTVAGWLSAAAPELRSVAA